MARKPADSPPSGRPARVEPVRPLLLSPDDAAKVLGIGRTVVYDLMRSGDLVSVHIGANRRVTVESCEAYVKRLLDQQSGEGAA